jgi:hypothetical protein
MVKLLSESLEESKNFWTSNWHDHSLKSEIRMWDFFSIIWRKISILLIILSSYMKERRKFIFVISGSKR